MTYKLEPGLGRIKSPIVLIFPDGHREEYTSGSDVVEAVFEKKYQVVEIRAVENIVEIVVEEVTAPIVNWTGEEQTFF